MSAGFVRELDEKRVVVLPILLEQCEIPPLLKDKRYADFSGLYDRGLLDLLSAILPDREKIAIALERLLLPAVAVDMPVTEGDFRAIHEAIHGLQKYLGLVNTLFPRANAGDPITARHMNQISEAITGLRIQVGLPTRWEHFPVKSGDPMTVSRFNELLGEMNQVTRRIIAQSDRNA